MAVEKVFKGKLKVGEEIVFAQGSGANCVWTFSEEYVGEQVLLYLDRPEKHAESPFRRAKEPGMWLAFTCGRSGSLEGATEDLRYLENMSKLRGKTRISGTLIGRGSDSNVPADGKKKKIKLIGPKQTYEIKTDDEGFFEIYDLPPGKYSVEPETPPGWRLEPWSLRRSSNVVRNDFDQPVMKTPRQVTIILEPKKHASVDLAFVIENSVSGRIVGPKGKPLSGVCVYLLAPGKDWGSSDCTDAQGQFKITSVYEGEYVLVANRDGKLSPDESFPRTFYPGVAERERATVLNLGPGDMLNNLDIVISKMEETVVLQGVLLHSDGKPAIERRIKFKVTDANDKVNKEVRGETDSLGRFSLTVLKGLNGEIAGEQWLLKDYYVNCPKVDELLAKSGSNNLTVFSNVVKIKTDQNVYDLELTLPFPACHKAK